MDLTLKLIRWTIFTVVFSLVPLGILYFALLYAGKPHGLGNILGDGELLLISWILGIHGLGELIPEGSSKKIAALICGGVNALVFIVSLAIFVLARYANHNTAMEDTTVYISMGLFVASFFTSTACLALAEI